jgi:hypothetical protein
MPAPKGNQFWRARSTHGRKPIFEDDEKLWEACTQYFDWVEDNPLKEGVVYQGKVMPDGNPLMRAMTISGMCLFLDICENTWANYRLDKDLLSVTTRAEKIIYNQKFAGAAAGLLNANIIARDLGLTDKQHTEHSGAIDLNKMTDEELDAEVRQAAQKLLQSTQD